jgi:antitoxin component of MazEF toxin-antitoxin module
MKVCDIRGWGYLTGKCALGLPDEQAIEIQKANECLIAAAPELYEALEELANLMNDVRSGNYRPDSFTTQPAEFALAKARGQTEPQEAPVSAQQAAGE